MRTTSVSPTRSASLRGRKEKRKGRRGEVSDSRRGEEEEKRKREGVEEVRPSLHSPAVLPLQAPEQLVARLDVQWQAQGRLACPGCLLVGLEDREEPAVLDPPLACRGRGIGGRRINDACVEGM